MDFFAAQELRRKKTKWLIALYVLAVLSIIVGIYVVITIGLGFAHQRFAAEAGGDPNGAMSVETFSLFHPQLFGIVAGLNLLVIGFASLSKIVELRGGGEHVASSLGGVRVPASTTNPAERQLLNVVEEMAIASGISVPPVYILRHEPTINAFAAGFTPADAVIGVNQGTLDSLSRDELQGVVAHEFSHILNGDMRINIRLIGILFGIQMLATIGYFVLRSTGGYGYRRQRGNGKDGGGAGALLVIAFALLVFGAIGQFFAKWIKATLSRQREYLADASAIQFTRNPDGLAGALKVIGSSSAGSAMATPAAEQVSHMFFANSFSSMMFNAFSTHPPLVPRIQQIDKNFDGDFNAFSQARQRVAQQRAAAREKRAEKKKQTSKLKTPFGEMFPDEIAEKFSIDPLLLLASIGAPNPDDVQRSQALIEKLPVAIVDAARHPYSARCIAFAMLIDDDHDQTADQWKHLQKCEGEMTVETTRRILLSIHELDLILRLPLMEMLQASLADLSAKQYEQFRATIQGLVKLDSKTSLFEFTVRHHLLMHLDRRFDHRKQPRVLYKKISQVSREVRLMLSAFASASHIGSVLENKQEADPAQTQAAFSLAVKVAALGDGQHPDSIPEPWTADQLEACMRTLHQASITVKRQFLYAAVVLITYDHEITTAEAEFLRAVAESLDCPVPVLAAGRTNAVADTKA